MASEIVNAGFGDALRKFAKKTGRKLDSVVRATCLSMFRSVVFLTPVDTGRARGNWAVGIGAPAKRDAKDKAGLAAIGEAGTALSGPVAGKVIYITNGLPYIRRLEYGWSKQNPKGMVRVTVAAARQAVQSAIKGA